MEIIYHQNLTRERWRQFSTVEQMANIGSEVGRAMKRKYENKPPQAEAALFRALELFDLTREDPKNRARLREVGRAREAFLDFFVGDNSYQSTSAQWDKYFTDYAIAARSLRQ